MNVSRAFVMALKSVKRNRARSFLTMLGIIIGITAVLVMVSLVQGMQKKVMDSYANMGTNLVSVYAYSSLDLTKDIMDKCAELSEHVQGVTPSQQGWSPVRYLSKGKDATIYYGSEDFADVNSWILDKGRMFTAKEATSRARVCVIGSGIAANLFDYENPIDKVIKINGEVFTVIGVFSPKYNDDPEWSQDNMVLVPYTNNRLLLKSIQVNNYSIKCVDSESTQTVIDAMNEFLPTVIRGSWSYYYVYSANQYIEESNSTMQIISLVLGGIAGISLLVGGIGIMNIMLVSVTERTREIGIRKAIGAKRRDIIVQFLIESATVSTLGGLIGIALGFLITVVLGKLFFGYAVFPTVTFTLFSVLFSVCIGVFFGLYPASRASRLNPIDALRNE